MKSQYNKPPLRLILTNQCNGQCNFCHNEGNDGCGEFMTYTLIKECLRAVDALSISQISLTGGEPTIRQDLAEIIKNIREDRNIKISLTTNGYRLQELANNIEYSIDNLNLSLISLRKNLAMQYQMVNPENALNALNIFPAKHKNLNVVVIKENLSEIEEFIDFCKNNSLSLDLIFLNNKEREYQYFQKNFLNRLVNEKGGKIVLETTPVLKISLDDSFYLRVKNSYLSALFYNEICQNCKEWDNCFEKVCAVRVYPNGLVSPCLFHEKCFTGDTVYEEIINTYNQLQNMILLDNFWKN